MTMGEVEVRDALRDAIDRAGTIAKLATKWKVSPALISLSASGRRRPSPTVLKKLGVVREMHTTYTYRWK